ncbi:hypothetical protein [Luethyella okanaganae]|uniref:Lipoprotein n=1 Tax=Luethyella okanaganae TaxID=69372 RepID=A0ABW1VFV7_9MICO
MARKLVVLPVAVLLLLSGCATSAPTTASSPAPATSTPASTPTASAAETACGELGEPASLSYNAWNDFQKGNITAEQRNSDLSKAAELFRAVDASGAPGVQNALSQVIAYIDSATPDASGQPYDAGTDEFFNLRSSLGIACESAGSELELKAHGG